MKRRSPWQALREEVCVRCVDGDGHGNCRIDPAIECPLQTHLPEIVELVRETGSDSMIDYVRELRLIACARCQYQSAGGSCNLREDVGCALDRYFPLIVETIESCVRPAGRHTTSHHHKD